MSCACSSPASTSACARASAAGSSPSSIAATSSSSCAWNDAIELVTTALGAPEPAISGRNPSSVATAPKKFTLTVAGTGSALPAFAMTASTGPSARRATPSTSSARPCTVARSTFTSAPARSTPITCSPSAASCLAVAAPIPEADPVTTVVRVRAMVVSVSIVTREDARRHASQQGPVRPGRGAEGHTRWARACT